MAHLHACRKVPPGLVQVVADASYISKQDQTVNLEPLVGDVLCPLESFADDVWRPFAQTRISQQSPEAQDRPDLFAGIFGRIRIGDRGRQARDDERLKVTEFLCHTLRKFGSIDFEEGYLGFLSPSLIVGQRVLQVFASHWMLFPHVLAHRGQRANSSPFFQGQPYLHENRDGEQGMGEKSVQSFPCDAFRQDTQQG